MDRDLKILKEVERWRVIFGRHIKELTGFTGTRACDNRLKILIDNGYLKRKKILFEYPYIYSLTSKSQKLLNIIPKDNEIRLDQFRHNIAVLDVLISLIKQKIITLADVVSEKEMHSLEGFGVRKHKPDFIFSHENNKIAVEIEMSLKSLYRLEANIKDNFLNYDGQIWYIDSQNNKLKNALAKFSEQYTNMRIRNLEEV